MATTWRIWFRSRWFRSSGSHCGAWLGYRAINDERWLFGHWKRQTRDAIWSSRKSSRHTVSPQWYRHTAITPLFRFISSPNTKEVLNDKRLYINTVSWITPLVLSSALNVLSWTRMLHFRQLYVVCKVVTYLHLYNSMLTSTRFRKIAHSCNHPRKYAHSKLPGNRNSI